MRKKALQVLCSIIIVMIAYQSAYAQSVLSGTVTHSETKEKLSSVSVVLKGSSTGTTTNEEGAFTIRTDKFPVVLVFSSVGYATQEVTVTNSTTLQILLSPSVELGQEVIVSASRLPEKILESPVTIERVNFSTIRNSPAPNYYDIVGKMKGVDVITSSLTFTTPTTRGFAGSGNTRFNQIVDGMDNQAPALNFSVGSVVGLTELDVESMEVLPGASSALYGPGGMNGTLILNSKNPFQYQGLSFQVKTGVMNLDNKFRDASSYHNWSVRWADKVSEKFAYKITTELIHAKDWLARDYRNYRRLGTSGQLVNGTRETDPNYDGVNVYGDETTINLRSVLDIIGNAAPFMSDYVKTLPQDIDVSRTGYAEDEVTDPKTINYKISGALHYKLTNKIEAILAGNFGTGNTIYTGSDRYSLKDLRVAQYKFELRADNWFLRAYTTQENAGQSHNLTVTSRQFNEAWKPSTQWYPEYALAYLNAKLSGRADLDAHNIARKTADIGRPTPGSAQFKQLWNGIQNKPISQNGGLFLDRSDLYMAEGQYNLTSAINDIAEVLVGGNWKQYVLNSQNTLFFEPNGPIKINELGAYIQVGKQIIPEVLKVTASGRYDKNENFKGRFTPRVTALIKPGKDHNIRLSYQTAYRFPSTQQQWINLAVGGGILMGSNKALWEEYDLINNPGYDAIAYMQGNKEVIAYKEVNPESVTSFELGYKSLIAKKLLVDAYVYQGQYENFIGRREVIQESLTGGDSRGVSVVVNSAAKVKTFGWAVGLDWLLPNNFSINGNLSSDEIKDVPDNFRAGFNAPKYRTVVGLSNSGFGKDKLFGFNLSWRWQDAIDFESDFAFGKLNAYHTVDLAFSIKRPSIKSVFKIGANNLLNQYYTTAIGNPSIGGLYYVSFAYNVF